MRLRQQTLRLVWSHCSPRMTCATRSTRRAPVRATACRPKRSEADDHTVAFRLPRQSESDADARYRPRRIARSIPPRPQKRRRYQLIGAGAGALLLLIVLVLLIRNWISAEITVPIERVRIAEVTRGPFIRDISAQGTVVAAVSPTMFAAAPGTVHFLVQAGDVVKKDQPIATLESPELRNELEREQASLAGLEVAVQRQGIDTRRQLAANQQASDLANVAIQAAERELRRAEDSWEQEAHQRARLREGARRCSGRARESQARDRDRRAAEREPGVRAARASTGARPSTPRRAGSAAARRRSQHEVAGQRHRRHARRRRARLGCAERAAPHRRRSDRVRNRIPGAGELCGRSRSGDGSGSDLRGRASTPAKVSAVSPEVRRVR